MIFNLQTDFIAASVVLVILVTNQYSHIYLPENRSFRNVLIHLLVVLALDSALWIVNLQTFPGARMLNLVFSYAYYTEQSLLGYLWGVYSRRLTRSQLSARNKWLHRLPLLVGLILLVGNPFNGNIFTVSVENVYARGISNWGAIYTGCVFYYLIEAMVLAGYKLLHEPKGERADSRNLLIASALPVLGVIVQLLFYGVSTIWSFGTVGFLILHFNVQAHHAIKAERELTQSRTSIMLSQIQPHFLYNSLMGIKELCDVDPKKAADALEHFSYFMRSNMDALTNIYLISFEKEIMHVEDYLYLEKVRFNERVNIQWDISYSDFLLPPLTLQPLVENAVHHGITKQDAGGTVIISSKKTANAVVITISDNGIGFDVNEPNEDGRTHIGIENVQSRLSVQCGATLQVESKQGVGTTVTITLPQKESIREVLADSKFGPPKV